MSYTVLVSTYPTAVERGLSIAEINRLRTQSLPAFARAHGLSVAEYSLQTIVREEETGSGADRRLCAWISSVVVKLTLQSVRIYIPSEYPPGGCESEHLLLHEKEHERLFRRAVERTVAKMRLALARAADLPDEPTPVDASDGGKARARLKRRVDGVVRPIYEDLLRTSAAEQRELDSPETYRRLSASCSGWKRN
jgi:hypothetical protein